MHVVVCGAGIIGASVTYYLAKRGVQCTVIERCSPACAASGKAGGFLARDWCDHNALGPLARLSFDMHAQLATELGEIDYRRVEALSVRVKEGSTKRTQHADGDNTPDWLDGIEGRAKVIGSTETSAQVHPFKLTNAMLDAAARTAKSVVRCAVVIGMATEAGRVVGVTLDSGEMVPADVIVIAMGPWTAQAARWLHGVRLPISGDPAHSIVIQPQSPVTAHALFTTYQKGSKNTDPELYPRPDGTVYVCGHGIKLPLPDDPSTIQSNDDDANMLRRVAESTSTVLGASAKLVSSNCCYLPCTPDGLPLIGKVPGIEGLYVGAGHSCWGILEGPATGACLAELIVDGKCSLVDLKPFDPARHF